MTSYTTEELQVLGVKCGKNVYIHKSVIMINPQNIEIGDNSRIDCFCLLSAGDKKIIIKNNVHIAAATLLFGGGGMILFDSFSCASSRCGIYTATDDFVDGNMTNPTIPIHYRKVKNADIVIGRHCVIGTGSTLLPGAFLEDMSVVGSMSLVKNTVPSGKVYGGIPARKIKDRNTNELKKTIREYDRDNKDRT